MLILDVIDFPLLIDAIVDVSWETDARLIGGWMDREALLLRAVGHELLEAVSLIWYLLHLGHSVTHLLFKMDYKARRRL